MATDQTLVRLDEAARAIEAATDPGEVRETIAKLDAMRQYLAQSGLNTDSDLIRLAELSARARRKLGAMLADLSRNVGGRPAKTGDTVSAVSAYAKTLDELNIDERTSQRMQQIATIPEEEFEKELAEARETIEPITQKRLLEASRSHWHKERRERRHEEIRQSAPEESGLTLGGPFSIIYADPPWRFDTYSEKGLENAPDKHYPTMSDAEIKALRINDLPLSQYIAKPALLFLWCTSSNFPRALEVVNAWDFDFVTFAVWDKQRTGTGYWFLNQHEPLIVAKRGSFPTPIHIMPSVFSYPRGRHSEKPSEIRDAIDFMFPDYDERHKLELFARERAEGWSSWGFEA